MKINRLWIIIGISILLLFVRLGATSVFQVAEARNSRCAVEMMQGDKIVPTFNGALRGDKPALEYYAMMAAYKVFGINETGARFFSAVCGLLVIVATYLFVKKQVNETAAWWSAFILLASIHTIVQFRLATPDPYLILCHVLSLYCFWLGYTERKFSWYAAMYLLLGLGFFAKGPVGILLPALTIFLFLLFTKQFTWKQIVQLQPWFGVLLMAAVSLPWYYLVHIDSNGAWTTDFFLKQNMSRFDKPVDGHGGIFVVTFLFVILGMFPFSAFFIRAFGYVWKARKADRFMLFYFIAFWCVVGFYFSSSTRLLNYTTPAYPFFAIILGCWLAKKKEAFIFQNIKPEILIILLLTLLFPVGIYIWAINTDPINQVSWIAFPLLVFPAGSIVAWTVIKKNFYKGLQVIGFTYMLASLLVFLWLFPAIDTTSAIKKHRDVIRHSDNVIAYKDLNDAFVFYANRNIPVVTNIEALNAYLLGHENTLIISRGKDFHELDNLTAITLYSKDRDLFSSQYSVLYVQK